MTALQKLRIRLSEIRSRLLELGQEAEPTTENRAEIDVLTAEYQGSEAQTRALEIAGDGGTEATEDAAGRELRAIRGKVRIATYLKNAAAMRGHDGPEAEFNAAVGCGAAAFPLQLLAPEVEVRATTDTDSQATQRRWLDRLFATSSAARVGITFESVAPGLASFPVTTAGATGQQQDRQEVTGDAPWTVGVTELTPKRGAVRAVFSMEDAARLPGLEDALRRDLSAALTDSIDRHIFNGDAGPSTASYDIAGLKTGAGVEKTVTQASKVKADEILKAFVQLVDGKHAGSLADLGIVASVGSNVLWHTTVHAATVDNETIAQFLMRAGLTWGVRADIDTSTSNGDFGAYAGRMRGIEGAGVAAVWESGELIRDPYAGAAKGEVALTLNYLWDLGFPRSSSFGRLKYVT